MSRRVITDEIWVQIQNTMQFYDCYRSRNSKNIMEAILWKLRTGAPWRDIPEDLCPWQTAYNRFNRWASKGLWENFFFMPASNCWVNANVPLWTNACISTGANVQNGCFSDTERICTHSVHAGYNACSAHPTSRKPLTLWRKMVLSTVWRGVYYYYQFCIHLLLLNR